MSDTKTFADFGVDSEICAALSDAGIDHPFPIQELTLPLGLMGADVIGQARTGTGKTLAFGIPLLQRVTDGTAPQALVIVPTRELCVQVRDDLDRASARRGTRVVPVYGGKAIDAQAEALRDGAPVVVGTPGRLLDLLRRGILDLSGVKALVLDEADEMLDLGFLPDVEALIEACAPERQTLLFSATMPSAVVALARRYMRKPTFLRAEVEEARIAPETEQHFFSCHRMDKPAVLARILQTPGRGLCVVFTRTKRMADVLASELRDRGIVAAPIHSDLRQEARERALSKFRKGTIDVLVATEVAARGLDISDVTHVVNYDCPDDEKMYLHRIGRTGRAGGSGVAITLAVWNELARLEMIKKALDVDTPTHEVFSTSPILDELFDLPARAPRTTVPSPPKAQGRSRKTRGSQERKPATSAAEPPRTPAGAHPAAAEETGDRTDAPTRTRTRRRRGERGPVQPDRATRRAPEPADPVASPDTASDAAPETAPGTAARTGGQDETTGRRRVRTRTRVTAGSAGGRTPAAGTGSSPRNGDGREADGKTGDGDGRGDRPVRSRTRSGRSKDARPSSRADAGPSERGRPDKDAGEDRGRRARPRKARPAPRTKSDRDTVERVRGTGKPALNRPMAVTHLP